MGVCAATRSTWDACGAGQGMGACATTCLGKRMRAHAASLDVGCMRRVETCAYAVTGEKDRQRERSAGPTYSMALSSICFTRLDVYFILFIWMLHVFHLNIVCVLSGCCICLWLCMYDANVYLKCFICFRRMLQVFYFSGYIHMLQASI
jgi:hypothetical protein